MAKKNRKSPQGLAMFKEPTPQERVESAAKYLHQAALEASPESKACITELAKAARQGASKVIRKSR